MGGFSLHQGKIRIDANGTVDIQLVGVAVCTFVHHCQCALTSLISRITDKSPVVDLHGALK
jgi:hypothetical protein